ncbi:MAG: PTS sugar transporter subunit IIA [Anaerolineales bacterium]|nr:PTS sugar transporter subunit IIA [Anaerolineales bacterium]
MSEEHNGTFQLNDLLTEETVAANLPAAGWSDAADLVGGLLVSAGKIEQRYIQAAREVVEEIGPYIVLAPGIALLHARPEDGVLEPCLALVTLSEPVYFGSPENDPVDLVFMLGAVDKDQHLTALQQLAMLLSNEEVLEELRAADSSHQLLTAVQSH